MVEVFPAGWNIVSVMSSATAQVSDGIAVSCDEATGASLSIASCSSLFASLSPADLRGSGASRQGPGEEDDGGCGSDTVLINFWLVWSWHYIVEMDTLCRLPMIYYTYM